MSLKQICRADELAPGQGSEFLVDGKIVAVFLLSDGSVYAVDGMCAHQGGPIAQGKVSGRCVTCPWHGWQYDISNGKNLLTQKSMLASYAVELRDGEVWIDV